MKLYENLSALRKKHAYTQAQIAKKLNVTRQTVSKWEMGLSEPSLDLLDRLAEIYHCSVDELMGRSNSEQATEAPHEAQPPLQPQRKEPFWSLYKEAFFVFAVGIVITAVYLVCRYRTSVSFTVFFAIECPILLLGTVITVCTDERVKTKSGLLDLILPLLFVLLIQLALALSEL